MYRIKYGVIINFRCINYVSSIRYYICNSSEVINGFVLTIVLAILFLIFQFKEYVGANYGISDSIYGLRFTC